MLSENFQKELENTLHPKMKEYFATNNAKKLLSGKESGHIMGTIIEEMCGDILTENGYTITKEVDKSGKTKTRAHSDFNIISSDGSVNRVNVKFSSEKKGQPNICSINRLMDALKTGEIDGYYMLKVKYDRTSKETKVYFVDILDYIDCLTYNGGTGQVMLQEKDFYAVYPRVIDCNINAFDKKKLIYDLYITKMEEHIALKQEQLSERKKELSSFSK